MGLLAGLLESVLAGLLAGLLGSVLAVMRSGGGTGVARAVDAGEKTGFGAGLRPRAIMVSLATLFAAASGLAFGRMEVLGAAVCGRGFGRIDDVIVGAPEGFLVIGGVAPGEDIDGAVEDTEGFAPKGFGRGDVNGASGRGFGGVDAAALAFAGLSSARLVE